MKKLWVWICRSKRHRTSYDKYASVAMAGEDWIRLCSFSRTQDLSLGNSTTDIPWDNDGTHRSFRQQVTHNLTQFYWEPFAICL
jgi:hypothetical protein